MHTLRELTARRQPRTLDRATHAKHHTRQAAYHHSQAASQGGAGAGGHAAQASYHRAVAAHGKHVVHSVRQNEPAGPVMRGKRGGTYTLSASGRKVYK